MAKKTESTLINMLLVLSIIAIVSAAALAAINHVTSGPREEAKRIKTENAIKQVIPSFAALESKKVLPSDGKDSLILNYAYDSEKKLIGTAIETYTDNGFGGRINLMVGFLPNGDIYNTAVISHSETPGLGDKMDISKSNFSEQFKGKNPATFNIHVTKDGGDVDAITAATISSRAFSDAVERAYNTLKSDGGIK